MTGDDTMMNPTLEGLMNRTNSKFALVTLSARRAREINSYFNQLGEGLGTMVPPQVSSTSRKPLSISFEEIAADKIKSVPLSVYEELEAELDAAEPAILPPLRVARCSGDPRPADAIFTAPPPWRTSEPRVDPALVAAMVSDIAEWIASCAA